MAAQQPKLLDQVRCTLRRKHYSTRTEEAYVNWIKRFILFHHKKHPRKDLATGHGAVYLPHALDKKYPNANREWIWQYVFPSHRLSVDPRSGKVRRHHVDESGFRSSVFDIITATYAAGDKCVVRTLR